MHKQIAILPANGVPNGGVKASGDDDEVGLVLIGDGHDDMVEGRHVVTVAHSAHGPGYIHRVTLASALAHLIHPSSARVKMPPTASHKALNFMLTGSCCASYVDKEAHSLLFAVRNMQRRKCLPGKTNIHCAEPAAKKLSPLPVQAEFLNPPDLLKLARAASEDQSVRDLHLTMELSAHLYTLASSMGLLRI